MNTDAVATGVWRKFAVVVLAGSFAGGMAGLGYGMFAKIERDIASSEARILAAIRALGDEGRSVSPVAGGGPVVLDPLVSVTDVGSGGKEVGERNPRITKDEAFHLMERYLDGEDVDISFLGRIREWDPVTGEAIYASEGEGKPVPGAAAAQVVGDLLESSCGPGSASFIAPMVESSGGGSSRTAGARNE